MLGSGTVQQSQQDWKTLFLSIRDEIKSYIVRQGKTVKAIHQALNDRHGTATSYQNFSKKLANSTIRYEEVKEIAEILGYEIVWVEKKK